MNPFKGRTNIIGKQIDRSKKIDRCFSLARNVAHNSPYGKIRHGAVLTKDASLACLVMLRRGPICTFAE